MKSRRALIAGASGLVGGHLLDLLLNSDSYESVFVLSRRPLGLNHPKIKELILDFGTLSDASLPAVDDVYCCLGTTMKKAGSKAAFRKVDYTYPLELAKKAVANGASQYLLVSALGAKKDSFFFYNKVKGEVEEDISRIPGYRNIAIFQPSLILGERKEERAGEGFAKVLMRLIKPLMLGPLRKFRPIHARTIAKGMLQIAQQGVRGVHVYESEVIKPLAGELATSNS